jgi:Mobilization protein NikA
VKEAPPAKPEPKPRRGTETRQKSLPVTTRYSPDEFAQLDEAASRAGLSRASFQRVQSLAAPPKTRSTRRAPIEREMLAKALGQLGKVGSNLNQLARAANLDRVERAEIMVTIADLRELLPVFLEALGRKP